LLLPDWIWLLPIVDSGANGGLKGDVGATAGVGPGGDAVTAVERRLGSLRVARCAGLGWRPSTVTCGMSISAGALGAACGPGGVVCDGAGSAGACPAAGGAAAAGSTGGAA
jgi:hypothetical protein